MSKSEEKELLEQQPETTQEELSRILQVRRDKYNHLVEQGSDPYEETRFQKDTEIKDIIEKFDDLEGKLVVIAGRIMSWRTMGKASFMDIADASGRVQLYLRVDAIGQEAYDNMKNWDIGDIIGLTGEVFRTKRGEISVKVKEIKLLSKSLLPLPEKWHGLKDTELRYRQRYVDLIVNPHVKEAFVKRTKIIKALRAYLDSEDFLEVETPILHTVVGGANAKPFITHHNTLDIDMYLRVAPELHLKRLIVGGFEKVYEIGRTFRNEGMSVRHNPEFTILELYQAYADFEVMMDHMENMVRQATLAVQEDTKVIYGEHELDMGKPFRRVSMVDIVKEHTGIDFAEVKTLEQAKEIAKEHGIEIEPQHGKGNVLNGLFERYCEEKLIEPTFIIDYPVEISPLAKRKPSNPEYTERFEMFIVGREYCNAYSELNNPIDQKGRFEHQVMLKEAGDDEANDMDHDFINALEYGMPPTGGLGIGVDRLVMLLTNSASIRDVLLFPTMRPIKE